MSARRDFDVVIAGGGMVGAALAALLATRPATRGLRIALVDPKPALPPLAAEPLDLRVSALSHAGERLCREVGVWPAIVTRHAAAYERMIVWDAASPPTGPETLVFDAAQVGEANLGHVVENRSVAAALVDRARALGVTLMSAPLTGATLSADVAQVELAGRSLLTGLVVAADGADSPLRQQAGIAGEPVPYPQAAVVCHLAADVHHGGAARQRFLPTGPLALLPLADGRVSLVWSTTPEEAAAMVALDDAAFAAAVTTASAGVLGALAPTTPRLQFPLRRFNAPTYTAARLVLIGDAAHTVHPLAGQGVNQGFLDVLSLADTLAGALAAGEDIGDPLVLGRYARSRRAANALMGAALDGVWRLFTNDAALVGRGRRLGLGLVNRLAPIKRLFVERALGG
jgi:2-octaprenylphenol hydroxylase